MLFDWDDGNRNHIARHNVTIDEAEQAVNRFTWDLDRYEVRGEERQEAVGETENGRILFLVVTDRDDRLRVVTAYDATRSLKLQYLAIRGAFDDRKS